MTGNEVHVRAREVLDFWFGLDPGKHFARDAALDREIAERFGGLRNAVYTQAARDWRGDPDALLAAIVLLDQFSRNLYRGTARAYEADDIALALTLHAITNGWDAAYAPDARAFAYMPLMHAEDASLQRLSIAKFTALGDGNNLQFARDHADIIARFGRFPSRNVALGRKSMPTEMVYLSRPDAGWQSADASLHVIPSR